MEMIHLLIEQRVLLHISASWIVFRKYTRYLDLEKVQNRLAN